MLVSVIIPVYNEKSLIKTLLERVLEADTSPFEKEVIVVDDGSTDGTVEAIRDFIDAQGQGVTVLHHRDNLGKAAAIRTALQKARGEIVLIQDADLEYSPHDYGALLERFADDETEAVYGSRFLRKTWPKGMKPQNWAANKLFTFLVNVLYGSRITDEGTAYKAIRKDLLEDVGIECSGFEFCPEVTAKLLKKGIKIVEVPVSYEARGKKEGKKPGVSDGIRILRIIIKYRP